MQSDRPALVPPLTTAPAEAPTGRTLFPTDPSLTPEARRADEEARVKRRVQGFAEEDVATARAQHGLPHPYFAGVRDLARAELQKGAKAAGVTVTTGQGLGAAGHAFGDALGSYGKTGDPGVGSTNPRGPAPDPVGSGPREFSAQMTQSAQSTRGLERARPLTTLTLEVRQFRDGRPPTAVVQQASGDPKFDQFVLETWTQALAGHGPPPPDAFHGEELRTVWAVEGWLGMSKKLERTLSYLPMPAGADKLVGAASKEGFHYEFRTRLLRVFH